MIFDNVDDQNLVWSYMPVSRGSILITTRFPFVANDERFLPESKVNITALGRDESWSLFCEILKSRHKSWGKADFSLKEGSENYVAGHELCKKLGGLPLGVRQVATLICERQSTLKTFLEIFNRKADNFQKLSGHGVSSSDPDFSYAVHTLWTLAFERLGEGETAKLLATMCFLFPDTIPIELFNNRCDELEFSGEYAEYE